MTPLIGVLALQGAFAAHESALRLLGVTTRQVRTPEDLDGLDGIVLPGGESTTMSRLLDTAGLRELLAVRLRNGLAAFGTCAGMILLARDVLDGRADQHSFGLLDIAVRRNGYGRQVDSFEADVEVQGLAQPFHAVFIRAPRVERIGAGVEVLAVHDGAGVLVRAGNVLASAFHPELTDDPRVHEMFVGLVQSRPTSSAAAS